MSRAWSRGTTPARRYALAGHPFGNNTKGKKRWLREMKTNAVSAALAQEGEKG